MENPRALVGVRLSPERQSVFGRGDSVFGHGMTRLLAGVGYAVGVLAVVLLIDAIGSQGAGGLVVVLLVGSLGGWISAFGGAWKAVSPPICSRSRGSRSSSGMKS